MRKIFTLALLTGLVMPVMAQNARLNAHHQQLSQWMKKAEVRSSTERVIGQRTWDSGENLTDSSKLWYGFGGTSTYDYNSMVYAYNYPYSSSPMFNNYQGVFTQPTVTCTRHDRWTVNPNTLMYGFYQRDLSAYDVNGNLTYDTILHVDSSSNANTLYSNTFDASGRITKGCWFTWSAGSADSAFKQYFKYNTGGWLLEDSLYEMSSGTWYLVAKTYYTYDGSGNPLVVDHYANNDDPTFTEPLIEQLKYENTYDAANRLLSTFTSYFDGAAFTPYIKDSFEYTGTQPFHTTWREDQYDPINLVWTPYQKMVKLLNTDSLPDTVNIYGYDQLMNVWTPFSRYVVTYNSQMDPLTLDEYDYDFTHFPLAPDFKTVYYYETYSIPTAVNETGETNILAYPNPAHDQITVSLGQDAALYTDLLLVDMQGKIQRSVNIKGQSLLNIDLSKLGNGLYVLRLQGQGHSHTMRLVKE